MVLPKLKQIKTILHLNDELLLEILRFLEVEDLMAARLVQSRWNSLTEEVVKEKMVSHACKTKEKARRDFQEKHKGILEGILHNKEFYRKLSEVERQKRACVGCKKRPREVIFQKCLHCLYCAECVLGLSACDCGMKVRKIIQFSWGDKPPAPLHERSESDILDSESIYDRWSPPARGTPLQQLVEARQTDSIGPTRKISSAWKNEIEETETNGKRRRSSDSSQWAGENDSIIEDVKNERLASLIKEKKPLKRMSSESQMSSVRNIPDRVKKPARESERGQMTKSAQIHEKPQAEPSPVKMPEIPNNGKLLILKQMKRPIRPPPMAKDGQEPVKIVKLVKVKIGHPAKVKKQGFTVSGPKISGGLPSKPPPSFSV